MVIIFFDALVIELGYLAYEERYTSIFLRRTFTCLNSRNINPFSRLSSSTYLSGVSNFSIKISLQSDAPFTLVFAITEQIEDLFCDALPLVRSTVRTFSFVDSGKRILYILRGVRTNERPQNLLARFVLSLLRTMNTLNYR